MKYRVTHTTSYNYSSQVSLCHNVARVLVRDTGRQRCMTTGVQIDPQPADMKEWTDLFGNRQVNFSIVTGSWKAERTASRSKVIPMQACISSRE